MRRFIPAVLLLAFLPAPAQARTRSTAAWNTYAFNSTTAKAATATTGNIAHFTFPSTTGIAELTTTKVAADLGNLTGKTVSATITITASPGTVFTYGGEGSWNNCPNLGAFTRLFLDASSSPYYPGQGLETDQWWSNPAKITISATTGTATISVLTDPSLWSDANGHFGNDPAWAPGFNSTVANVKQIGLAFGGGCFADVGISSSNTSASLGLNAFSAS